MDFQRELRAACAQKAKQYGYAETALARGFEAFVVHLSAADGNYLSDPSMVANPMEADLGDFILRQNDGGVDGYLEDESNKVVLLIQAKWSAGSGPVDTDQLKAFLDVPSVLASPEREDFLARLGPDSRTVLAPLHDRMKDGWTVVLRFMTNMPRNDTLEAIVNARGASYRDNRVNVQCELVTRDNLKAIWHEAVSGQGGIEGQVRIQLQEERFVPLDDPRASLVAVISGNELANLFRQYKNALFAQNIRLPLLSSTRINPDIAETAKSNPKDFFYFNNGVSAICTRFERKKGIVEAWDLQVINGAQTVGTLGSIPNLSPHVKVLFRLTTATKEDVAFRDDITRTNNTQNEVVPWDFRANDPIQKWLESALKPYSASGPLPSFWYKRKRGLTATGRGGRALEPEYLGKLRHAYRHGPVPSYKEPKLLASLAPGSGLYAEAFGVDGTVPMVWPAAELDEALFAIALDTWIIGRADEYRKDDHAYGRWLKRLSRYMVAVVAEVGRRASTLEVKPKVLIGLNADDFSDRLDPVLRSAMRTINTRYELLKTTRVQPEYDIARDQKGFEQVCDEVVADLTA